MKRLLGFACIFSLLLAVPAFASGLEDFLGRVNVQARADLPGFSTKVSSQFLVPVPKVDAVLKAVVDPADAFMIFQLAAMTKLPPERVLKVYSSHRKQGWGAMAQQVGIKPGSAEFKALKRGELSFSGHSSREREREREHHREQEKEKHKEKEKDDEKGGGKGHHS